MSRRGRRFPAMLHVVLFRPEIPQNTGNIGRLCAIARARLHLVRPLGFEISDRHLRRSGMDYWKRLDWRIHDAWEAFAADPDGPERLFLFTTKAEKIYWDQSFRDGDGLLFGNEGSGAPGWLHRAIGDAKRLFASRSPNLLCAPSTSPPASASPFTRPFASSDRPGRQRRGREIEEGRSRQSGNGGETPPALLRRRRGDAGLRGD